MPTTTSTSFAGYDCVRLENGSLRLWVTVSTGPRIIGLALPGQENLFAELPEATLHFPGAEQGLFYLRGGHRLWHAPEDPYRTYCPDDDPVEVAEIEDGLKIVQQTEPATGIQKSLTIAMPGEGASVTVDHILTNHNRWEIECAPWAITQLKPGGVAFLPLAGLPADEHGLLPNRRLALWPYAQLSSPHLRWGDHLLRLAAQMTEGAFKIGFPNPAGWLAYQRRDSLFVKWAPFDPRASYFDQGSSSECYCNADYLELETLGPRAALAPGATVAHREVWTVAGGVPQVNDDQAVLALLDRLRPPLA